MKQHQRLCICIAALLLWAGSRGDTIRITNVDEFIDFMKEVNDGYNYTGDTVVMESDVDVSNYSSVLAPIGNSTNNFFSGTFDGQGYVISGFKIESSSQFVGLFGTSMTGIIVKNVVLDGSCSFTSSYKQIGANIGYIGGIIGYCFSEDSECSVEKCVNMASVSFKGNSIVYAGGIFGACIADNHYCIVNNSVNYGAVVHAGAGKNAYIGGIAGICQTNSGTSSCGISSSVNNGAIEYSGSATNSLYIGGIAGYTKNGLVQTCVNTGNISVPSNKKATITYIGDISGHPVDASITNCYWSESSNYKGVGGGKGTYTFGNYMFDKDFVVKNNKDRKLGELLSSLGVKNCTTIAFNSNGGDPVSPLVMFTWTRGFVLPTPKNGPTMFIGWYFDAAFTRPFNAAEINEGDSVTLYARWTGYNVSYETVSVYVQLVTKDMSQDEVKAVIKEITDCTDCYIIEEFVEYGSETFTIIKFVDTETSTNFVRTVNNNHEKLAVRYIIRTEMDHAFMKGMPIGLLLSLI